MHALTPDSQHANLSLCSWASGLHSVRILTFCFMVLVTWPRRHIKLSDHPKAITTGSCRHEYQGTIHLGSNSLVRMTLTNHGSHQTPFKGPEFTACGTGELDMFYTGSIIQFRCLLYFRVNGTVLIQTINSATETPMSKFLK